MNYFETILDREITTYLTSGPKIISVSFLELSLIVWSRVKQKWHFCKFAKKNRLIDPSLFDLVGTLNEKHCTDLWMFMQILASVCIKNLVQ